PGAVVLGEVSEDCAKLVVACFGAEINHLRKSILPARLRLPQRGCLLERVALAANTSSLRLPGAVRQVGGTGSGCGEDDCRKANSSGKQASFKAHHPFMLLHTEWPRIHPKSYREGAFGASVRRGPLDAIDDDHGCGLFGGLEFQTEL